MRSTRNGQGGGGGGAAASLLLTPSPAPAAPVAPDVVLWLDTSGRLEMMDSGGLPLIGLASAGVADLTLDGDRMQLITNNVAITLLTDLIFIQQGATVLSLSPNGIVLSPGAGRNIFLGGLRTTSPGVAGALWRDPVTGLVHIDP